MSVKDWEWELRLERKKKTWEKLREKPQTEVDRDVMITVLNAVHIAHLRKQMISRVTVVAETESAPLEYSRWFYKGEHACTKASSFLRSLGYESYVTYQFLWGEQSHKWLVTIGVFVSQMQRVLPEAADKEHWRLRGLRVKAEGGVARRRTRKKPQRKSLEK
jgi:hypothetical protein